MASKTVLMTVALTLTIVTGVCAQTTTASPPTAAPSPATVPTAVGEMVRKLLHENAAQSGDTPSCTAWTYPEKADEGYDNWVRAGCTKCAAAVPYQSPRVLNPDAAKVIRGLLPNNVNPYHYVVNLVREETHNNYAFKVKRADGKPLTIHWNGNPFRLEEFHFHAPAEHVVVGQTLSVLEMHVKATGKINRSDVVAVFTIQFRADETPFDINMGPVARALNGDANQEFKLGELMQLFAQNWTFVYGGSLTTPPCTGNVVFFVMQRQYPVQRDVLQSISNTLLELNKGFANVRPLQNRPNTNPPDVFVLVPQ